MDEVTIIAISGASGSGKTSLVKALATRFQCPAIHFDDHIEEFSYPKDMERWYQQGADVSKIKTPGMLRALESQRLGAHKYIFIEEPFGRSRTGLAELIDYVVLLDIPLEVCLSRVIRRNLTQHHENNAIIQYLLKYEAYFRHIYSKKVAQVRTDCDLVLTSVCNESTMLDKVANWVSSKQGG